MKLTKERIGIAVLAILGLIAPFNNPIQASWVGNVWWNWWLNGHLWFIPTIIILFAIDWKYNKKRGRRGRG